MWCLPARPPACLNLLPDCAVCRQHVCWPLPDVLPTTPCPPAAPLLPSSAWSCAELAFGPARQPGFPLLAGGDATSVLAHPSQPLPCIALALFPANPRPRSLLLSAFQVPPPPPPHQHPPQPPPPPNTPHFTPPPPPSSPPHTAHTPVPPPFATQPPRDSRPAPHLVNTVSAESMAMACRGVHLH